MSTAAFLSAPEPKSTKVVAHPEAFHKVTTFLLEQGVGQGVFPGAVLVVAKDGREIYRTAVGHRGETEIKSAQEVSLRDNTVFDVASLTAQVVTSTIIMRFVEDNKLSLTDRVSRYVQGFSVFGKSAITIAHLLGHSSGLPAWLPFFEDLLRENSGARMGVLTSRGARDFIFNSIKRIQLKSDPGTKQVYSDLGLMLLGQIIEMLSGLSLDKAAQQFVLGPLNMKSSSYIDLSMIKRRGIHPVRDLIAPTEECSWRKRILCGEVHDDNAWAMGGIAGHSGLFSTATDLTLFAQEMIDAYRGNSSFLRRETVSKFWTGPEEAEDAGFRYGWDAPNRENNLIESKLSAQAVGGCGFTGCSLWIEPNDGLSIVLMSNRINPTRANKKIRNFRPDLHDLILEVVRGA